MAFNFVIDADGSQGVEAVSRLNPSPYAKHNRERLPLGRYLVGVTLDGELPDSPVGPVFVEERTIVNRNPDSRGHYFEYTAKLRIIASELAGKWALEDAGLPELIIAEAGHRFQYSVGTGSRDYGTMHYNGKPIPHTVVRTHVGDLQPFKFPLMGIKMDQLKAVTVGASGLPSDLKPYYPLTNWRSDDV